MTEAVLEAILALLQGAGLNALANFPDKALRRDGVIVCAGVRELRLLSSGAGEYLGTRERGSLISELYGFRLELLLNLDIYTPVGEANPCDGAFRLIEEALGRAPAGLRVTELSRGAAVWDRETEMLLCPVTLRCSAYLLAEETEEPGEFSDFILKGVLKA